MLANLLLILLIASPPALSAPTRAIATTTPAPAGDLIHEPAVLSFCRTLLKWSRSGREGEQSAFVSRTEEGTLFFVCWPADGDRYSAKWSGPFPDGTIAIVHTHPPGLPLPSSIDEATARRTGIPVYVVTMFEICRTTGGQAEVLARGGWAAP